MNQLIPTLNVTYFRSGHKKNRDFFVSQLKEAFETTGFFFLKNHSLNPQYDQTILEGAKDIFTEFFDLPLEIRKKYEFPEEKRQRGYTPMRIETGEFATVPDEKHFFQIGADRNVWVPEVPELKVMCNTLFSDFRSYSLVLLRAIALSLDLPENYFVEQEGNSIMRAIDYPATATPLVDDAETKNGGNIIGMCASKHTDINMITLLEAKEEGLQLQHEGEWIPITISEPGLIIVNAGDMLQHLTGGRYKSGTHRVVCNKDTRRFSIPYFCHIRLDQSLVPLPHLGPSDLEKYPYKICEDYLNDRLKTIGLS